MTTPPVASLTCDWRPENGVTRADALSFLMSKMTEQFANAGIPVIRMYDGKARDIDKTKVEYYVELTDAEAKLLHDAYYARVEAALR